MSSSDQRGAAGGSRHPNGPAAVEEFLRGTQLFKGCDAGVVSKVAAHAEVLEFARGAVILRAGAASDGLVLLLRGRASHAMVSASSGAATVLDALQPGDHAGDVAVILRASQPYSLLADDPCVAVRLRGEIVDALIAKVPQFLHKLARRLAARNVGLSMTSLRGGGAATPARTMMIAAEAVTRFVEVSDYEPAAKVVQLVPSKLILAHRLLPLRLEGNALTVGMVSPRNSLALTELRQVVPSLELEVVAISQDDFSLAVQRLRIDGGGRGEAARGARVVDPDTLQFDVVDQERDADKAVKVVGDEVVRAVSRLIAGALQREASDVHVEPEVGGVRVRYRVQGMLVDAPDVIPPSFAKGVVARIKILAGLDITDRRTPQDGRIGMTAGNREVDLRVSTLPSSRGEKVVLRVLEGAGVSRPLEHIFLEPNLSPPRGARCCGPTARCSSRAPRVRERARRSTRCCRSVGARAPTPRC